MKIRRNIASVPARSAQQTWRAIVDLVTGPDTVDFDQLESAASIMESLIADEHPASVPIVFRGAGPHVVIYCLYDEDAMDAGLDIDPLNANATSGNWRVTAPCDSEDVDWMNDTLKQRASRISVHAADVVPAEEQEAEKSAMSFDINWKALEK